MQYFYGDEEPYEAKELLAINDGCMCAMIVAKKGRWGMFPLASVQGMGSGTYGGSTEYPFIYDEYEYLSQWNANVGYLILRNDKVWSVVRIKEGNKSPYSYKTLGEKLKNRQQALELALKDAMDILVAFAEDDFEKSLAVIGKFDDREV